MDEPAPHPPQPLPPKTDGTLIFEQPLNERIRTFLRLDFLYNQALYQSELATAWSSRAAMTGLIDMLAIAGRGDLRTDVLKELDRQLAQMTDYQHRPGVDAGRLRTLVANLARLREDLHGVGSNFLQSIRDSEFLSSIKHRSAIPGGTCEFDLPDYYYWLSQPAPERTRAFGQWLAALRPLCDGIAELMWLMRQNGRTREETAKGGVFVVSFDRDAPPQLLRIALPAASGLYPEMSGSHYRCSVRFLKWNGLDARPSQAEGDIPFLLSSCS